jgi:protein-S-isoprenylcysteine O-methyltransferase Ste14
MIKHHTPQEPQQRKNGLTGEYTFSDAGQIIFALLFMITWLVDTFIFKYTTFLNNTISNIIRLPFGIILLTFSGYLAITGLHIVFGKNREKPIVIRESIFSFIRHPIYLSEILLYLGLLMFSLSLAAVLVWFMTIIFLHYISRYEEGLLLTRFGEEYAQYMRDVPMWIPRLWKK